MENLRICSVSDEYISFLRDNNPRVYSNKEENRIHERKYLGVVLKINQYEYFIPMSSPKNSDYQLAGDGYAIKKSIIPIIRMIAKDSKGEKVLRGTLRISHMIPVPDSELIKYDIESEQDKEYRDIIYDEEKFIRNNKSKILSYAKTMYNQKSINYDVGYVRAALDFKSLELLCSQYKNTK